MTFYPTQSHYRTEPTSPCPILMMPDARLGSDKYQFKSHWFNLTRVWTRKVQTGTCGGLDSRIVQRRRWMLYSFSHPAWCIYVCIMYIIYVCICVCMYLLCMYIYVCIYVCVCIYLCMYVLNESIGVNSWSLLMTQGTDTLYSPHHIPQWVTSEEPHTHNQSHYRSHPITPSHYRHTH